MLVAALRSAFAFEEWERAGVRVREAARSGAAATGTVTAGSFTAVTSVRVGRASVAVRTRLLPPAAADAFLPEVVSALRRSSASSRLESLAMSAR